MAKRNSKLKFSCLIPCFHLCRSKKPSKLPETSVPVIHWLSSPSLVMNPKASGVGYPDLNFPAPPPSTPDDSFIKLHLSPKIAPVDCRCRARSCSIQYLSPDVSFESAEKKEATRLRIMAMAKARDSKLQWRTYEASFSNEINGDIPSVLGSKFQVNKKEKMEKVKDIATVSSLGHSGCFSSELGDENDETETLISTSRSFSDDSSFELDQSMADDSHMEIKRNKKQVHTMKKKMKRLRTFGSKTKAGARGSTLKHATTMIPPPSMAEGKVRESVAVVKESEDPYEDFKRSMLEMILEKQMFEANDLEQLLQCFLSLNSKQYHRIIVEAFTEIWEALFSDSLPP